MFFAQTIYTESILLPSRTTTFTGEYHIKILYVKCELSLKIMDAFSILKINNFQALVKIIVGGLCLGMDLKNQTRLYNLH